MTQLESKVQKARNRLTINRWVNHACMALMIAAGAFAALTVVVRLFGWEAPLGVIALALVGGALITSVIWAVATRMDMPAAAAALDQAGGFRERLSSGLYCAAGEDPFEKAVLVDAQQISATVTVSRHIRLQWPPRLAGASLAVIAAAATLLVPSGVLVQADPQTQEDRIETERTIAVVRKRAEKIKRIARTNPELKELAEDLDKLGEASDGRLQKPADARHLALKKLDRLSDALKQRRESDRFQHARELKKMLRSLKPPADKNNPMAKLAQALARGDFKSAREQLKLQQQMLAELAKNENPQQIQAIQKQLDSLARQLEKLAKDERLAQKLQQAGLKQEDIERMLKNLTPEDVERIKQQLAKQGLSQQAVSQLMQKLQQKLGARQLADKLAQALQQAAASCAAGQPGQAADGLESAAGQLSNLEMLEQEMNQIDAMMAEARGARCSLCTTGNNPVPTGMGPNMMSGRGGLARETQTSVSFAKHRQKVKTTRGAIIGQYLVDGEQYKGEIAPAVHELITAAESDATDAIDRARIPRRYHKAVKNYFSDIQEELAKAKRPFDVVDESAKSEAQTTPSED
ncbi:MAG: hypothetical protein V3W34_14870 [Phycisphaerae bacterium]